MLQPLTSKLGLVETVVNVINDCVKNIGDKS